MNLKSENKMMQNDICNGGSFLRGKNESSHFQMDAKLKRNIEKEIERERERKARRKEKEAKSSQQQGVANFI
jgi:predicted Fe-S protein YdhL (DUF1289 family)